MNDAGPHVRKPHASILSQTRKLQRVIALSSQVARGHVGLSGILPVLHRFGIETVALPTVLLSNHPGHPRSSGQPIEPDLLQTMIATLALNGWLKDIDAVLIGYLPTVEHVELAVYMIDQLQHSSHPNFPLVVCDPVIGDDPKGMYVDRHAAEAIRDLLIKRADLLTPNRFELEWLAGVRVSDARSAVSAAKQLAPAAVAATSIPEANGLISNVYMESGDGWRLHPCSIPRLEAVPNGTGDVFSALLLANLLTGYHSHPEVALERSSLALRQIVEASSGRDELDLIGTADVWMAATIA